MKYELTNETKLCMGTILYRIKALKSFNGISIGDLGGFIEKLLHAARYAKDAKDI